MAHERSGFDTKAIHAGQAPDPITKAVMPPLVLSSTFAQEAPGKHSGFEYARTDNPTRQTLEHCIAALESGNSAVAFGSGCAAMTTLFQTLRPGDHIVACDDVYGGTFRILDKVMKPFGIETSWVNMTDLDEVRSAITANTKLVWIETPTNPLLKIVDIAAVTKIAKEKNILVGVDNTFATPALQRPLELGADLVLHSMTKYINGHSDVVGGIIVTKNDELNEKLRFLQNASGAILSPFDSFMVLRGVKTLGVRMDRHCDSAQDLAQWLNQHSQVEKVYYPCLESHPNHDIAKNQMLRFGGMISFVVKGGWEAASNLLQRTQIFTLAESLGGVESLIEHPGVMTHGAVPKETRKALGISDGLIRVSVGIEDLEDLRSDLDQALKA